MISKQQVEHMAKLARIELTEKGKKKFQKELSSILDYVEKLNRVDTSKIKRIAQITGLKDVMRSDTVVKKQDVRNKLLKQAPKKKQDYFKVPKILE
jgi:aspartyl/glutamyl-tRNA(Asn/Gln) amidotransferase C subunit